MTVDEEPEEEESEEEYEEPELEFKDAGLNRIIIVDCLPVVPKEKYEKLLVVITKIYSRIGTVAENGIRMPTDESGGSKGYAFVEFTTPQEAQAAFEQTNGYKLDKSHIFIVTPFVDFDRLMATPEEYAPPPATEFTELENLKEWMIDARARDQFVIRHSEETEIYWNELQEPELEYERKKWTDGYVLWSPLGSYLATFHRQGIAMWGGKSWNKIARYMHPDVKLIDFSPCERYLVTWSSIEPNMRPDVENLVVWDVRSGKKLRGFTHDPRDERNQPQAVNWPIFKWNHDGKYLGKSGEGCSIMVYQTPDMKLLDKKSIKIAGMSDFCWSPTDDLLSIVVPEADNNPARVVIMEIPSRIEKRQKNLFSVADIKMHWQNKGDYLCIKADRLTKAKKSGATNFEFFRIRQKDIPVDTLEYKDNIVSFAWEPEGHRMCIIHGEGQRPDVSFHSMKVKDTGVDKLTFLKTLEKRPVNNVFWAPHGTFVVLAGLKNLNGVLEFWNTNEMECMAQEEHFMATDVEWDPTGRFVASSVTHYQLENGYNIWTFQGNLRHHYTKSKFFQFLWRPRPASLLSKEKEKEIKKNLAEYSKRYQKEDDAFMLEHASGKTAEKREMREQWAALLRMRTSERQEQAAARRELRDGELSDDEGEMIEVEETFEEVVDVTEEIMRKGEVDTSNVSFSLGLRNEAGRG